MMLFQGQRQGTKQHELLQFTDRHHSQELLTLREGRTITYSHAREMELLKTQLSLWVLPKRLQTRNASKQKLLSHRSPFRIR